MKYCMDTSSFLEGSEGRSYEMEYFTPLWANLDGRVMDGTVVSPYLVLKELEKKEDDVYNWAKERKDILFKQPSKGITEVIGRIRDTFPEFVDEKKPYWADADVIALAKVKRLTVVTQEEWNDTKNPNKFKIPHICEYFGVKYIKMIDLIKREQLTSNIGVLSKKGPHGNTEIE